MIVINNNYNSKIIEEYKLNRRKALLNIPGWISDCFSITGMQNALIEEALLTETGIKIRKNILEEIGKAIDKNVEQANAETIQCLAIMIYTNNNVELVDYAILVWLLSGNDNTTPGTLEKKRVKDVLLGGSGKRLEETADEIGTFVIRAFEKYKKVNSDKIQIRGGM